MPLFRLKPNTRLAPLNLPGYPLAIRDGGSTVFTVEPTPDAAQSDTTGPVAALYRLRVDGAVGPNGQGYAVFDIAGSVPTLETYAVGAFTPALERRYGLFPLAGESW